MERKYYLRGLGLGIAMTAIIMGIATPKSRAMTNDEIIARAKELGLVENTVLSNTGNTDSSQESGADDRTDAQDAANQLQDDLTSAGTVIDTDPETEAAEAKRDEDAADGETAPEAGNAGQEDANSANPAGENDTASGDVMGEGGQENTTAHGENSVEAENNDRVITPGTVQTITVNSGDSSYTVAKKLADVGVVASAQDFDTFLCQYGYDKRLRTGTFSIPTDADDEQIARIVTGMELGQSQSHK